MKKTIRPSSRVVKLTPHHRVPQRIARMTSPRSLAALSAAALTLLLAGCGASNFTTPTAVATAPVPLAAHGIKGTVHGGQQPVAGSTIQVYAAATTGYGAAAIPVGPSSQTATDGTFSTGTINCTTGTYLYILATQGDAGAGNNVNLRLFTPLGLCDNVNNLTNAVINEITTVAGAYALGGFMTGPTSLATTSTNTNGLALAFADVNQLVNIATGLPSGPTLPAGATLPVTEINTLADALATCINTNGLGGSSNNCSTYFTDSKPAGGNAASETITATLNIVHYPGTVDVADLYNLASGTSPFQPTLSAAPNDFTLAVNYAPTGLVSPSGIAFDSTGAAFITDKGANSLFKLAHAGTITATQATFAAPSAVAVAVDNGIFGLNSTGTTTLRHYATNFSTTYTATSTSTGPTSIALDPNGLVWIAYADNSITSSDAGVFTFTRYTGAGITAPLAIATSAK